jgi:predicted transcriptional regulator
MQKQINKTSFEVIKGERTYQLLMENDSPLGEIYDVLFEMRNYLVKRAEQTLQQDRRPEENKESDVELSKIEKVEFS